jgi:hypothetical protein
VALLHRDEFGEEEVDCIYIAARRSEAKRVEEILSSNGIDYVVDVEPFEATILGLFRTQRDGLGFYVVAAQGDFGRRVLRDAGLLQGLVDGESTAGSS